MEVLVDLFMLVLGFSLGLIVSLAFGLFILYRLGHRKPYTNDTATGKPAD